MPSGRGYDWSSRPGPGPGRHMFRRIAFFLFLLIFIGAIVGAFIATGLAAFSGINRWLVVGATAVGLLGFALIARQVFRKTWEPVGDLIDATRRLGEGDHEVRLRRTSRGPFGQVASNFNKMAERLEEEDQRRRRLLADIGHELRTPMTVIRGEIEAVLDGLHDSSQLADVVDEVELIERLLDDLRVLSMAEAGTLQLETEPTDMVELVGNVLSSFRARSGDQAVEVVFVSKDIPDVEVDSHRIHQVISNLVSNALNQMPDGGRLEVSVHDRESLTVVTVADTGPGLPEEDPDRVFERFVRASDSTGTGLGLSISRDLVVAHGGTLVAENMNGAGALFTMSIPNGDL